MTSTPAENDKYFNFPKLSKTYFFHIPEDFLLASASAPALYLFFKEYFLNNLHKDTEPKAKLINLLLVSVCIALGVLLTVTMFLELTPLEK